MELEQDNANNSVIQAKMHAFPSASERAESYVPSPFQQELTSTQVDIRTSQVALPGTSANQMGFDLIEVDSTTSKRLAVIERQPFAKNSASSSPMPSDSFPFSSSLSSTGTSPFNFPVFGQNTPTPWTPPPTPILESPDTQTDNTVAVAKKRGRPKKSPNPSSNKSRRDDAIVQGMPPVISTSAVRGRGRGIGRGTRDGLISTSIPPTSNIAPSQPSAGPASYKITQFFNRQGGK